MASTMTLSRLKSQIVRCQALYHNFGNSDLSDSEYDKLIAQLRKLSPDDALLTTVGATVPRDSLRVKRKHAQFIGSITNTNTLHSGGYMLGLITWLNRYLNEPRTVGSVSYPVPGNSPFIVTDKLDGFSVVLSYRDGQLVTAVSRGDGLVGEDITANAILFKQVPTMLNSPASITVRGEVVLLFEDWIKVDPDKRSNPRNLTPGIARRDDGEGSMYLTFYAFSVVDNGSFPRYFDELSCLAHLGFTCVPCVAVGKSGCLSHVDESQKQRSKLPYLVDGLVVRLDDNEYTRAHAKLIKNGDGCPFGQVAYKYPAAAQTTTLDRIEWQVGHTGRLTPVAVLSPVRVGGVTVTNATLCNMDEITRLDLRLGDTVVVYRAGDVIPKIATWTGKQHNNRIKANIEAPLTCPVCFSPVQTRQNTDGSDTVDLYCVNITCPAKVKGKIQNWIEKVGIDGLGDEILAALMATPRSHLFDDTGNLVESVVDLYRLLTLPTNCLSNIQVNGKKLGAKRSASILAEIDKTRTLTIDQFLGSLGINHLGRRRVALIREAWMKDNPVAGPGYLHELLDEPQGWFTHSRFGSKIVERATEIGIPGIAASIQKDLDDQRAEIEELLTFITIKPAESKPVSTNNSGNLSGKSFCLTGAMRRKRDTIAADIEAAGGEVKDDVVKGLSFLVQADPSSASSKSKKATKLGIKIIDEDQLESLIEG